MSFVDSIKAFFRRQSDLEGRDTDSARIDAMSAARHGDVQDHGQREGGSIPPNYLPTGVDEGRPRK